MRDTAAGRCGQHVAASTFAGTKGSFPAGETDVRRPDMEYGGGAFQKSRAVTCIEMSLQTTPLQENAASLASFWPVPRVWERGPEA